MPAYYRMSMILYNVTITLDVDIHEEWVNWMRTQHIPDVMMTNLFISYRMSRLIDHEHADSEIYTIQYLVKDMAHLLRYHQEFAQELQRQHRERGACRQFGRHDARHAGAEARRDRRPRYPDQRPEPLSCLCAGSPPACWRTA